MAAFVWFRKYVYLETAIFDTADCVKYKAEANNSTVDKVKPAPHYLVGKTIPRIILLFGRATQLNATLAVRMSVSRSVRLSVCHAHASCLNCSRYRNTLCTIRKNDVSSFLRPNCAFQNLQCRVSHRTSALKRGTTLSSLQLKFGQ